MIFRILFLLLFLFCKKIEIPIPYNENRRPDTQIKDQNIICLKIESNPELDIVHRSFVTTYSISRLFSSRIENVTGSLKELIEKSIINKFYKDYNIFIEDDSQNNNNCNQRIEIWINYYNFSWFPPQEFIQNPQPIRKGKFVVDFSSRYSITLNNKIIVEKKFDRNFLQNLLPLQEYRNIELTISDIIKDLVDEIYLEFWKNK